MRVFFIVLVLFFSFQSWSSADDIRDFQIEGISVGDSALDFFSESEIKKNSKNYFKDKRYTPVQNNNMLFFKTYDAVDFIFKSNDKNYIIKSLSGILVYEKNIKDCYKRMDEIVTEMDVIFSNQKKFPKRNYKHRNDKSGKSKISDVEYSFKNGSSVVIACYDYSEEHGSQDHLSISLDSKEIDDFFSSNPYD